MAGISASDLAGLPDDQKNMILGTIEQAQIKDSLRMYNSLVERCFVDCVDSFRRKDLDKDEEKCVTRCAEKFIKATGRTGQRFAELTQAAEEQLASKAGTPK
uniref:Mitochondrial import inner membrane translocase subunit n=1 Tax=Tetraselmis sp. GSL018 TaxID=582737 RepID=A0A061R1X9_9CHLO|mmetsp:Transcript_42895/g.101849  ORF Transcript_42895/g.101849 Transcript_42895/m.101849 type:complete len:102 (+) Transcript_42895:259-564(+)|eukprot:CAMPEP_0177598568 /NCGR_PEP_ID=MMETSP0419_2-20121207/12437_1 /TAXON_ID=582737 /ORGANISM="Tetraselmis sp., Strain GSL018" /LENGTH=101 /DNA_ID=CAMNT_0019091059 /DNA_START=231 /DNA_END=536 /DNA_ORIENTATION=+